MDAKYGSILRKTYFHALVWLYAVRALLYILPLASGHDGQRRQGAGGRLFSISIRTHQPPFEMEDNYDDYQSETVLPLYENVMLEVSDEIAATLSMGGRLCDSYKRQKRRNGECSLDTDPGFEANVLRQPMTPDEYIEARETTFALYDALAQLPSTQARRVYQHYFLGMSKAEIAAAEGVGRSRICCSVERGLAAMKNILKKSL